MHPLLYGQQKMVIAQITGIKSVDLFLADTQAWQMLESPFIIIEWLYWSIFFQDSAFHYTFRFFLYSKANQQPGEVIS